MTKTSVGRGRGRGGQRFVDVVLGSFGVLPGWGGAGVPGGGGARFRGGGRVGNNRCSIPPTNHVHSRTFVNGIAKCAPVTYSRMVMPLAANPPTLSYHPRTVLRPIPE